MNWLTNGTPPHPETGVVGDFFFDTRSRRVWGPKTADGWGEPIDLSRLENGGVVDFRRVTDGDIKDLVFKIDRISDDLREIKRHLGL